MVYSSDALFYAVVFPIFFYLYFSFIISRIVAKFNPLVPAWQSFVPVWSAYLLTKCVDTTNRYFLVMVCAAFAGSALNTALGLEFMETLANLIIAVIWAQVIGLIAQALGKNFWLHAIMAFLTIPLVVTMSIMAFDSSRLVNDNQQLLPPPASKP